MNDNWLSYPEHKPDRLDPCLVLTTDNLTQAFVGYYLDGDFYRLKYDATVGTLRKAVISNVFAYANIFYLDYPVL